MKAVITTEQEIHSFMEKLQLRSFQLKTSFDPDIVNEVHREFHMELVRFFQEQGSNYPNK